MKLYENLQEGNYFSTAIYVRLSIENSGKDDDGDSIANQISFCKAYLAEHTDLKLYDIYEDNGEKGTNFDRPESMLTVCKALLIGKLLDGAAVNNRQQEVLLLQSGLKKAAVCFGIFSCVMYCMI